MRVYGSRARGDAAPDSDLDIYLELESVTPQLRRQISEVAWEVGLEMDRVISTLDADNPRPYWEVTARPLWLGPDQ